MNPQPQTQQQPPPPPQQQPPPPPQLQPNRPSTSCDIHPQETFTGFCPSCLCERLAVLDPNNNNNASSSSTSNRKPPTSSTAAAALKAIFRPSTSQRNNRPPTSASSNSLFPELRRTKSFSASKNEGFSGTFEPQRKSCDVRGRSTLYSLFNQADERKIPKPEPPRLLPDLDTRNLASSSTLQQPFIESEEEKQDNIVVEDSDEDEIRVLEPPQPLQQRERELSNVIEESFHEIVEEEPDFQLEPEPELVFAEEESLKPMKEHMDLDSQAKKSSGRDLKEIAGSFWSAASVFSKKLQKWRQKQKAKKRGPRNGAVSGSSTLLPVEKPIGRQFRETQSEIADYGFGRRSCDTDPRFSLDIARMSFDDPRYSFEEPRASWDGYLIGKTFPRVPLPTMLSVVEDAPVHVQRTDSLIPVEEPPLLNENGEENVNMPGNSTQTKEYYSDSSTRRRKSLDRSSSIRKTAAAVVAEMDELKPVSNAKKVDRDLRDYSNNSNSNSNNSLRDDCSESFELGYRDNASVVGSNNGYGDRKGGSKKSSSRWSKAWSIWGFIHRRGGGNNNKEEEDDRYSSRGGNGNGVERSYSESWQEFRGERNGDVRGGVGIGSIGGGGGLNRKILRSNSSVSWRNAPSMGGSMGGGGIFSGRKSDVQSSNGYLGRKARDEFVLERNRSARYSPNDNMDNGGLLKLYLTPGGRRNGASKGRSNQAHSIARSVLRLY
ncbi:hypothetical protein KIW84_034274 [Lathyrus oleraceus]|uniref:Uncharacterized protein n=1 Tax=Pisum sativum TaxID=3888 RepID=A0A9D4Y0V4_PEA|nr:hypothetical protein KIW84_034274 [Pisum sativum]